MSKRPQRLVGFSYVGMYRYSLTFCTHQRRRIFTDASIVDEALQQILQAAASHGFEIVAYCFMPDHLHLLVSTTTEQCDLIAFAHAVKQRTAYTYRQKHDAMLWQKGYYEHVVRDDESMLLIARYILENPVRGRLASEPLAYPFAGSFVFDAAQLRELWHSDASGFEMPEHPPRLGTP